MSNLVNDLGGASGFGEQFITRNDDGYTSAIDLKPIFGNAGLNFFGASYTSLVINNNGNVVFGSSGLSSYTPWAMQTNTDIKMLAAYFADVDTRGYATNVNGPGAVTATPGGTSSGSNLVWYDMDSTGFGTLTITWDDVGYFSSQTNKLNAFQMRLIGTGNGGFDVEFRYENIDWTTGNASGGTSGLGGIVARAGFTAGDGVNYYELPQSGIQDQMLDLEITPGNTGVAGYYKFSIFGSGGTGDNTINGTSGDDFLVGGPGNDTINGLAGNDQIDGQGGTNLLVGGVGNDVYIIRSASDTVVEAPGEGNDTVQSSITFSVAGLPNIENITLTGNSAINATGNAESNWLISNSGNNILDGGTGIDTASYENTQSAVSVSLLLSGAQATGGGGTDTLIGIENLVGSIYNDALVGAADDNFLDGLAGADSMSGGAGNDTYVVDSASDVITENDNEGTDTVQSSIAYTLGANLENLLLTGLGNIDGVGNASNNVITGNSGSNNLDGGAGNDSINGGAGDDSLTGGTGNDALTGGTGTNTYLFARGFGVDTVASFAPSGANTDIVNFTDIASTEATISRSGLDAIIKIGTDQVTLLNYFNHTGAYQVASIRFANGVTWNDIPVNEAPAGTDKSIAATAGAAYILKTADFGFTDPNDSPANALAAVKITTLPASGALKLNGVAVAAGQSVTAADIAANKLTFTPTANASLTFQVQDNGGTANGGADLDPTPNTLSFTLGSGPAPLTNNDDIYTGTTAANSVDGLGGDDFLYGLDGNDSLFGGSGDDFLYGGSGNDSLVCGPGNNQLWGGSGNDYLFAGLENDLLDGGSGVDTASYASVPTAVNVSLLVLTPQNTLGAGIDTLASIENLIGGAGNDSLTGNAANNILQGGAGADTLTGGAGLDNFVLNTTTGGADLIKDFLSGTDILRFRDGATGFGIGDKDHVIDGGATINAPGGFAKAAELVIATANIAGSITAASAAAAIGSATAAYAAGDARVFAVDNGADSALFLFKSAGADALVSAGELTLLGTLQGTAQTALADYGFIA